MRSAFAATAVLAFLVTVICPRPLFAQPPVVQQPPDAQPADNPVAETEDELQEPNSATDDLVRQWESNAARGGEYLPKAIGALARLGAWQTVDRWLPRFNQIDDPRELARAATTIGPNILLRISLRTDLSTESQAALAKLSSAAKAYRQSEQRLAQAIADLAVDQPDRQLAANRILMQGGEATIKVIVQQIVQGTDSDQQTRLLAILEALGEGGRKALHQVALYGTGSARSHALAALVEIDLEMSIDAIVAAAFGTRTEEQERNFANELMGAVSRNMDQQGAEAFLADRLSTARIVAQRSRNTAETTNIWSVDPQSNELSFVRSQTIYLAYRNTYDAAQRLLQLGDISSHSKSSALIASLNYLVMIDVDWNDASQLSAFEASIGQRVSEADLLAALRHARRQKDDAASIGILRVIASRLSNQADSMNLTRSLMETQGADGLPVLVDTCRDSVPRVRYEASLLVAQADIGSAGRVPFAGRSIVRKTLVEMSRLSDRPTAILIETRPFVSVQQQAILGKLGLDVQPVQTVLAAEREIARGGDIRLVVSKIELSDFVSVELVDRVRRQPFGARVPIVLYWDDSVSEKVRAAAKLETTSRRWEDDTVPAVQLVPLPGDPTALSEVLQEVESKRRLPALTGADRRTFQMAALESLEQL